jgi:hypothetical protein
MTFKTRSEMYRSKAIECEQKGKEAIDQSTKREWEDLAIEWHAFANFAAKETGQISIRDSPSSD